MFKLSIEDDEGKTTVVPLARDEMTIGRLEGNTIRLTERNMSRKHARLSRQNGALYIEDLDQLHRRAGQRDARSRRRRRCARGTRSRSATTSWCCAATARPIGNRADGARTFPSVTTAPLATRGRAGGNPHPGLGRRDGRATGAARPARRPPHPPRPRTKTSPPKPMTAVPEQDRIDRRRCAARSRRIGVDAAVPEPVEGQPTIPLRALGGKRAGAHAGGGPVGAAGRADHRSGRDGDRPRQGVARDRADRGERRPAQPPVDLAPPRQDRARRRPLHDRRPAERQRRPGQRRGLRADRAERRRRRRARPREDALRRPLEDYVFDPHAPQPRRLPVKAIAIGAERARRPRVGGGLLSHRGSHEGAGSEVSAASAAPAPAPAEPAAVVPTAAAAAPTAVGAAPTAVGQRRRPRPRRRPRSWRPRSRRWSPRTGRSR